MSVLLLIIQVLVYIHQPLDVHDFHISRCEINYETDTGDLQIAAHIYMDDLENALMEGGKKTLKIASNECAHCDAMIEKYINQKLTFKVNNRPIPCSMLGKEASKDKMAVWCYLEIQGLKNLSKLDIENRILLELFNDQKNIVDFTVNKKKMHFSIFDAKKTSETYLIK